MNKLNIFGQNNKDKLQKLLQEKQQHNVLNLLLELTTAPEVYSKANQNVLLDLYLTDLKDNIIYKCNKMKLALLLQRVAFSSEPTKALTMLQESIDFFKPLMESLLRNEVRASDQHAVAGTVLLSTTQILLNLKSKPYSIELVNETQVQLDQVYTWLKDQLIHQPDNVKEVFTEQHRTYTQFHLLNNDGDKFFEESLKQLSFSSTDFENDLVIDYTQGDKVSFLKKVGETCILTQNMPAMAQLVPLHVQNQQFSKPPLQDQQMFITMILEGKIKEFQQAVVSKQAAMPFLASPQIPAKTQTLSLLSLLHKAMSKAVDISQICENIGIDRLQCDLLIMKCLRLKQIQGYIDDSEGKLIVEKITSLYLDNNRIEEIENKVDKILKMIGMVEKSIEQSQD